MVSLGANFKQTMDVILPCRIKTGMDIISDVGDIILYGLVETPQNLF